MTVDESIQLLGLVPSDLALPEIRRILEVESDAERNGDERRDDLALLCCVQLFSRGHLDDVLRIWDARCAGMDLGCVIDVQFLCGAGLEATKLYLAARPDAAGAACLQYIRDRESAGDLDGFSPERHLASYRGYFGVA